MSACPGRPRGTRASTQENAPLVRAQRRPQEPLAVDEPLESVEQSIALGLRGGHEVQGAHLPSVVVVHDREGRPGAALGAVGDAEGGRRLPALEAHHRVQLDSIETIGGGFPRRLPRQQQGGRAGGAVRRAKDRLRPRRRVRLAQDGRGRNPAHGQQRKRARVGPPSDAEEPHPPAGRLELQDAHPVGPLRQARRRRVRVARQVEGDVPRGRHVGRP